MTATVSAQYTCFPTCSSTDGRFLTIAGAGYNTLINSDVVMKFGSPAGSPSIEIGIFDGETGGLWDAGTTPLTYTLYADPTGDGTGTTVVTTFPYSQMIDNDWKSFTVNNVPAALAPSGNYLYRLLISSTSTTDNYWSSFKVRSTGTVALKAQAFSVAATANSAGDLGVIYPTGENNPSITTYDGTWHFYLDVPTAVSTFSVWDGDMDYGSYDCSSFDTDDQNTANNVLPAWASPANAVLEGVATGVACVGVSGFATGTPPDDNRYATYRRSPAVTYQVITPYGETFTNSNPSGGREWEEYKLATAAYNASQNDAHANSLPAGIYEVSVTGMDLNNLNGWRFFADAIGVNVDGDPTPPLDPTITATGGTRTQGYWKTHSSAWPVQSITVGCVTYTKAAAIEKMKMSVNGDKTYSMFDQLVAAKLNLLMGANASCISATVSAADVWMCAHPLGSNVSASSSAWTGGADDLHEDLDEYNNGHACAPHVH
jgi:hypothetical protein